MEIENAIFQDLESFGKERIFKMAMKKVLHFYLEKSYKRPKIDVA